MSIRCWMRQCSQKLSHSAAAATLRLLLLDYCCIYSRTWYARVSLEKLFHSKTQFPEKVRQLSRHGYWLLLSVPACARQSNDQRLSSTENRFLQLKQGVLLIERGRGCGASYSVLEAGLPRKWAARARGKLQSPLRTSIAVAAGLQCSILDNVLL